LFEQSYELSVRMFLFLNALIHEMRIFASRVQNSKQFLSCKLKFVCDHGHNFGWILSIASVHAGQDEDKM